MTQRALSKKVWPGVWTNSVCGHPMPGEAIEDAIRRRAKDELGIEGLQDIACVLPKYKYTTPPYNDIIENEFCPVFVAFADVEVAPNPDEVEAFQWLPWPEYVHMLSDETVPTSYWANDQYQQLKDRQPFMGLMPEL